MKPSLYRDSDGDTIIGYVIDPGDMRVIIKALGAKLARMRIEIKLIHDEDGSRCSLGEQLERDHMQALIEFYAKEK